MNSLLYSTMPLMLGATDIDSALSQGGIYLMKFAFMLGVIVIIIGGWSMHSGNGTGALMSILAGLVIACAVPFMKSFFTSTGQGQAAVNIGSLMPLLLNKNTIKPLLKKILC